MKALGLYHDLKERRVILKAQGEYLKVDAPAGIVTEEDKAALVEFKPILLQFLSRAPEEQPLRESKARWAGPGNIRIRDPFTNEWHEWPAAKCLPGVVAEADRRRKGDRWR
jgi:hypothetical protein